MEVIGTPREDHHLCNKEVMGSSSAAVKLNDTNRQADCRIHALDRQASKSCQQAHCCAPSPVLGPNTSLTFLNCNVCLFPSLLAQPSLRWLGVCWPCKDVARLRIVPGAPRCCNSQQAQRCCPQPPPARKRPLISTLDSMQAADCCHGAVCHIWKADDAWHQVLCRAPVSR